MPDTIFQRTFVPADFDPADFADIEPLLVELRDRAVGSPSELERWLLDLSELQCAIDEKWTRIHIDYTCHTNDPRKEEAYLRIVRELRPKLEPMFFELQRRYVGSEWRANIETTPRLRQLGKNWQADVEIFREPNVALNAQITETASEYDKLCGAMTVEFDGKTRTLQQMARYLEEPDRNVREQAWRLVAQRRLADREKIDAIYDRLIQLRDEVGCNADFDDYRGYIWKSNHRFDYSPDDCHAFAETVEQVCMPVVERLNADRKQTMKLDALRPWDTQVDPRNRPALRPFDESDVRGFFEKTREALRRVDPRLGEQFAQLTFERNLDLDSRLGKRPGGYQSSLEESKQPFIFMNAAGTQRDVDTLLHEAGHAFHYLAAADEPLVFVRHSPLEFAEVASMSMELLGMAHYGVFYDDAADAARARRLQLEGAIRTLPWIATIDQFQHWLYTHPVHSRDERTAHWLSLMDRFGSPLVDWTGCEGARAALWQRQLHLFNWPFYYIEYGIAQLGALQVWHNYLKDPRRTLKQLLDAFALGGTRPLPQLFEAAGIRFDFSIDTLRPLMAMVEEQLPE